jgi:hypothetical protein
MPLDSIPVIGFPLADTLDPPLRVIVESAYDRTTSPGVPTPANPLYFPDPATFATNLLVAVPTGLDNGISDFTGSRPFGTTRPDPYGVGGAATVGINGQPTPPPSSPTTGTSPTIPLPFAPALDPTNGLSNLAPVTGATSTGQTPAITVPTSQSTTNTSSGPRLNVVKTSLGAPGPQQQTSSPTGSSATNPIGSVASSVTNSVAGVTNSISSTLSGLSKTQAGTK